MVALNGPRRLVLEREFLAFLAERDGAVSVDDQELPRRRLGPEEPGPRSDDLLFVETLKRLYAGERFTVDLATDKLRRSADPVDLYMAREERHHTELLASLIRTTGHDVPVHAPPRWLRSLLGLLVRVPHPFSSMLLFCGEYIGVMLMIALERRAGDEPAKRLLHEILVDEIGHLAYNHGRLGLAGLAFARMLLLPLLRLAALREPLLAALVPERDALMCWHGLAAISDGAAFLPALHEPSPARVAA